jgi:hypothetical protein
VTGVLTKDEEQIAKLKLSFTFMLSSIPEKSDLSLFVPPRILSVENGLQED